MHTARDQQRLRTQISLILHTSLTPAGPVVGRTSAVDRTGNGKARPHDHQLRRGVLRASRVVGRRSCPGGDFVSPTGVYNGVPRPGPEDSGPFSLPAIDLIYLPISCRSPMRSSNRPPSAIGLRLRRLQTAPICTKLAKADVSAPAGRKDGRALYIGGDIAGVVHVNGLGLTFKRRGTSKNCCSWQSWASLA